TDLIALAIYIAIVAAFYLPVILNPSGVFLGHLGGDAGVILYTANQYIDRQPFDVASYGLPFGRNLTNMGTYQPVFVWILPHFSKVFGVMATYNYYIIFNLWFAATAAYLLARMFLHSKHAAFVSGLIFGFSPYMIARAIAYHVNLVATGWVVLFVASLFYMERKKTALSGILCGVSLFLVGFTSYYNLFFSCVFAGIFYIFFWKKGAIKWITALATKI
ncbi:MAG TPA: hypothetical protein VMW25_01420, partial [Clostridia bacterium]|nr:hypothetical protein [Clostridia bacterium]